MTERSVTVSLPSDVLKPMIAALAAREEDLKNRIDSLELQKWERRYVISHEARDLWLKRLYDELNKVELARAAVTSASEDDSGK